MNERRWVVSLWLGLTLALVGPRAVWADHDEHAGGGGGNHAPAIVGAVIGTATIGALIGATQTKKARWDRKFRKRNAIRKKLGVAPLDYCAALAQDHPAWVQKSKKCDG
jgi:hypothetical protein